MNSEKLQEIKGRFARATPGPWEWDVHSRNKCVNLLTTHSGKCCVMGFKRWGAQGAAPTFQVYKQYEGSIRERRGIGLFRADIFTKSHPGLEHHVGWDDYIDHPDAEFIAHAIEDVPFLLNEIERLQKELEKYTHE